MTEKNETARDFGDWEPVIGLEVHIQLKTQSKMFSGSSTEFGAAPNTQVSGIDLGLPGVLPIPNRETVHMAVKFGLAVQAQITEKSVFARKNYFYPDLPKGYQITQDRLPIVKNGYIEVHIPDAPPKRINIARAHLEEDAGKSMHEDFHGMTGIDLNRAGNPLLEIVSAPEMHSAKEAVAYLKTIHTLVRYLEICDGNMQEGSFRCDANVSVKKKTATQLGTRAEIKNLNSFRFIERAINYEIQRQIDILESGGSIPMETRLYDPDKNETRGMRLKEQAHEYRYFPDPDLLPVFIDEDLKISLQKTLPELPWDKCKRFQDDYELSEYDANLLTTDQDMATFYETLIKSTQASPKLAANWVVGELLAILNKEGLSIAETRISAEQLATLLNRIEDNTISGKIAKTVFATIWETQAEPDTIIEEQGLKQITDTGAIEEMIDAVIADNPQQLADYRGGKSQLFGYFVGQVMQKTQGKANPKQVNELLKAKLDA